MGGPRRWNVGRLLPEGTGGGGPGGRPGEGGWFGGGRGGAFGSAGKGPRLFFAFVFFLSTLCTMVVSTLVVSIGVATPCSVHPVYNGSEHRGASRVATAPCIVVCT